MKILYLLSNLFKQFVHLKGGLDRTMIAEYVPQMHQRACGMKRDLEIFLRIVSELDIDEEELPDVKRHQHQTIKNIEVFYSIF